MRFFDWAAILLVTFAVASTWGLPAVGRLEGYFAPVMGDLALSDPRPVPPPAFRNIWSGEAQKLRDCDFVRLEWFQGPRYGRKVQVATGFTDAPEIRPPGASIWHGLIILLDQFQVRENSHADVLHRCPLLEFQGVRIMRPWLTRSAFYDGEATNENQ